MLDMSNRWYESYYGQRGLQLFYDDGQKTFEKKLITWSLIVFMPFDGFSNVANCSTHCAWNMGFNFQGKEKRKEKKKFWNRKNEATSVKDLVPLAIPNK